MRYFCNRKQKMNNATVWPDVRKVLIKSTETGQDLTRSRVPAKVSASLLRYLTNLLTDGEHFKEEVKKTEGTLIHKTNYAQNNYDAAV